MKKQTIGIFAPANPICHIDPQLIEMGKAHLQSLGFGVRFAKNVWARKNYTAGTVAERVADFHELLNDDEVTIMMAVYGGYNSNQLLDHLDYALIKQKAKPIIGFSDVTALLNAIYVKTGLTTLHGPSFINFCNPTVFAEFVKNMLAVINKQLELKLTAPHRYASDDWFLKENFQPREIHPHSGWHTLKAGEAQSVLVGGNLDTLLALVGTPYLPDFAEKILLIESAEKNPAIYDRQLTQLQSMGAFKNLQGLMIGQFPANSALNDLALLTEILHMHLSNYNYPILTNTNFSHTDPLYTLPIGGEVKLVAVESGQENAINHSQQSFVQLLNF